MGSGWRLLYTENCLCVLIMYTKLSSECSKRALRSAHHDLGSSFSSSLWQHQCRQAGSPVSYEAVKQPIWAVAARPARRPYTAPAA